MPPKGSSDAVSAKSIAEAKLERQRKRIEEADAVLNAPLQLDRRSQTSRGKGKQWKPFDFSTDPNEHAQPFEGGVPVSEVRVNTFRAPPSRDTSLTRSMSVMSHRTSETGPSDMDRQDSALTDGFQLYKSRRGKKTTGELSAYEDKPEERQTTVEANYDKRETLDVFGNALPGPEFLPANPGFKDGQLQFIQHPNGDISAHLWSANIFEWQNIGQFSNIRKKVEGQLASDRLKGETAYQTLQQNTLAYFRTIAKQREANAMGVPFGAKEIQAAMPEPRVVVAAPTGLKESVKEPGPPASAQNKPHSPVWNASGYNDRHVEHQSAHQKPQHFEVGPRNERYSYAPNYGQQPARYDYDPFYPANNYQQIYGGYQNYANTYYRQPPRAPTISPYMNTPQRVTGLNYDFHFPPTASLSHVTHATQGPGAQAYFAEIAHKDELRRQQEAFNNQAAGVIGYSYANYHDAGSSYQSVARPANSSRGTAATEIAVPRPKPITAYSSGTRMSDHLLSISEHAKERSLSQTNIRTVLYDPYQKQSPATKLEAPQDPEKQEEELSPLFTKHVARKALQPPTSFDPTSSKFFPTVLAPQVRSSSPVDTAVGNELQQSSPDTQWSGGVPVISTDSDFTPKIDADGMHLSATTAGSVDPNRKKTYDEELNDWWTSGKTFARQEEFFQSIAASSRHSNLNTTMSPPAHLTPIGPPSKTTPHKQESSPPFNMTTTRLLIPVLENLASYVQGPIEKRRDYFCQWSQPPEWCIDRGEHGNDTFFDSDWGQPPARVGRDPRYSQDRPSWLGGSRHTPQAGRLVGFHKTPGGPANGVAVGSGLDRRFGFGGGRY